MRRSPMIVLILAAAVVSVARADLATTVGDVTTLSATHAPSPQANEGTDQVVAVQLSSTCNVETNAVISECEPIIVTLSYIDSNRSEHSHTVTAGAIVSQDVINSGAYAAEMTIPGSDVGGSHLLYWFTVSQHARYSNVVGTHERTRALRLPETGTFDVPVAPSTGAPIY